MELDNLKKWLASQMQSTDADMGLASRIEDEIAGLNKNIMRRKMYGTLTLVLCSVAFSLLAYTVVRIGYPATAVAGIVVCVMTFLAGLVALHKMQFVSPDQALTVFESQQEHLRQVQREIVFYRKYSPYFFVGVSVGGALIAIGSLGSTGELASALRNPSVILPLVIAIASMAFAIKSNRDHIRTKLKPLERRVRENLEAISTTSVK